MSLLTKIKQFLTPADAGDKEVAMSDTSTTVTPPAASGGITKQEFEALLKPIAEGLASLSKSHGELASSHKALHEHVSKSPASAKAEDVAALVTKTLAEHQKVQDAAAAKTQAKAQLRDKVIKAHLPGVSESFLKALPDTEDEAALTAAAAGLRKDLDALVKPANVGGAGKDGGTPAAKEQEKKGGFLTMAGTAPAAVAAANTAAAAVAK